MTILRCECVDGWSGHGETIARDAHDCNININTILALNIIGLLVSIGLMVFCGWALWKMILRSRIQKNTPQGDQQHALAPNNSSAVDSSSSSSSPFRLCYDVLVDPPQRAALLSIIYGLFDFLFFVIKLSGGDPLNGMMVDHRGLAFLWACGCAGQSLSLTPHPTANMVCVLFSLRLLLFRWSVPVDCGSISSIAIEIHWSNPKEDYHHHSNNEIGIVNHATHCCFHWSSVNAMAT